MTLIRTAGVLLGCTAGASCSLLLDTNGTQCRTNAECAPFLAVCDTETSVCKPEVIIKPEVTVTVLPAIPNPGPDASFDSPGADAPARPGSPDASSGTTGGPNAGTRDGSSGG